MYVKNWVHKILIRINFSIFHSFKNYFLCKMTRYKVFWITAIWILVHNIFQSNILWKIFSFFKLSTKIALRQHVHINYSMNYFECSKTVRKNVLKIFRFRFPYETILTTKSAKLRHEFSLLALMLGNWAKSVQHNLTMETTHYTYFTVVHAHVVYHTSIAF